MHSRIEDYALVGNCRTAALIDRTGGIDWLCLPRFDSGAVFASLLGTDEHGTWTLQPKVDPRSVRREYEPESLVLRTEYELDQGKIAVLDFMPIANGNPAVVRIVEGLGGDVEMQTNITLRFDYGWVVPWVERGESGISAVAGPDRVTIRTPTRLRGRDLSTVGEFRVREGERVSFVLQWTPSHEDPPTPIDPDQALRATRAWWRSWVARCSYGGRWRDAVIRSLITLKALTFAPTGGIVAAPTTSLPERIGGVRNWDYRYCWLRDATYTLLALLSAGYGEEAAAWQSWLLRAVAGSPDCAQIMYGIDGTRRLTEQTLDWLPGYEGSAPVRIGNDASEQLQLDVYGELVDAMFQSRKAGLKQADAGWRLECALVRHLAEHWTEPDHGIWEVRGGRRHFTHSKVMAWVAVDRAIRSIEQFGLEGPADEWRALRTEIRDQVLRDGFDERRGAFIQAYGGSELDASLLMIPLVGFLDATDPRVAATVSAILRELSVDGLIARYRTASSVDGLPPGEGVFIPCSLWMADNLALAGRASEALELVERVLALRNDVGLLAEEYDPDARRFLGNFPQAFSHVALVNSCLNLSQEARSPTAVRQDG